MLGTFLRRLMGEAPAAAAAAAEPGTARLAKERLSLILQHSSSNRALLNDFRIVEMHKEIFAVIQVCGTSIRGGGGVVVLEGDVHLAR